MKPVTLLMLTLLGLALPLAGRASERTTPADGTLLAVTAQGSSQQVPDIAVLHAGIVSRASDSSASLQQNSAHMARLLAALKKAGIAERDIQTRGIQLNPQYHYRENQPPTITGYEARNSLSIKVRQLGQLGSLLDTLVSEGANEIHGPNLLIDKPEDAYDSARRAALETARNRARMYADSLGLRVRRIVSIDETGQLGSLPAEVMMSARQGKALAASAMDNSIAPGENSLEVTLNVVFELGQ